MTTEDAIRARVAELARARDQEELAYARLEAQIAALRSELLMRKRSLDMTHGRIAELESLLTPQRESPDE